MENLTPELKTKLKEAKTLLKSLSKNELIIHCINLSIELNRITTLLNDKGETDGNK